MKKGIFYAALTAILFVTLEPVSKLIANEISPYAMTFWRFLIGSVLLVPFAAVKVKKENIKITGKDILRMTLLGILVICLSMVVLQIAVKQADAPSLIAIIFSSNSVFTIIFSVLLIKEEKLNKNKVIALIFGVLGVVLCADFSSGTNLTSVLYTFIAALSFSLYTVLSQKYKNKTGGIVQTAGVFLAGSIVLLIILLITKQDISMPIQPKSLLIMLYLGILVTGVGYVSYFKAMEKGGAIMASMAFFIKPILTPFVTLLVNGIKPDGKVFLAVACIVVASYFSTFRKNK